MGLHVNIEAHLDGELGLRVSTCMVPCGSTESASRPMWVMDE
jgi:hypothetical protein